MRSLLRIICVTSGVALLIAGSILGYNQQRLWHLEQVSREQSEAIHAKAEAARTQHQTLVDALRAADKVADPLKRCLEFPDVPPLQWSPAFVAERCRLASLKIITVEEIDAKLAAGDVAGVDATFDGYAAEDASDPKRRGILFRSFESRFESTNPAIGDVIDRWVKAAPHSAYALAARGLFRERSAQEARGTAYTRDTPQANFDAMYRLRLLARSDLDASLKINPRFVVPATYKLPARSADEDVATLGRKAVELAPDNYRVYLFWSKEASPQWGGSLEALDEIAKAAKAQEAANPLMALVEARVRYFQMIAAGRRPGKVDYLRVLAIAPDSFALRSMGTLPLAPEDAALVTPLVRFEPTVANYMDAAQSLAYARQMDWSNEYVLRAIEVGSPMTTDFAQYARALAAAHKPQAAEVAFSRIFAANPRSTDAMMMLATLYENDLDRHDDAVAMARRFVEAYPESEESWSTLAFTYKKTDTPKYCEAKSKAYPDKPVAFWDYDRQCGSKDPNELPANMENRPFARPAKRG